MVKTLSETDKEVVAQAITAAEKKTSAELVAVITKASDHYQGYVMFHSLILGSFAAFILWYNDIVTPFPLLLLIQCAAIMVFLLIPPLARLCFALVPLHIRHHRAKHRAFEEYLRASYHVSSTTPVVLFYVSLAERYVHILPSRLVREKIPDAAWVKVVGTFTDSLPKYGLKNASIEAIQRITDLLAPPFPFTGAPHHFQHPAIESGTA